jgi:hypothetical protein
MPDSHLPPLPMGRSPRVRPRNTPGAGLTDKDIRT